MNGAVVLLIVLGAFLVCLHLILEGEW